MKLLVMQLSPAFCYFLLGTNILIRHPQSVFFPECGRPNFTPIKNNR